MKSKHTENNDFLFDNLRTMLNPKHPLYQLSEKLPWDEIEVSFSIYYSHTGRPAKSIRLMVSLLILKRIYDLGDETVVAQWVQNPYMQYFSGEKTFQWQLPCEPSDLVHFRKRIGKDGVEKIFKLSVDIHGKSALDKDISIDTTVQEKNITFPTDVKLYKKIIDHCVEIAKHKEVKLRQSYKRVSKKYVFQQRGRKRKNGIKIANAAKRKLHTIAGRLVRELKRKLTDSSIEDYSELLELFESVLNQKKDSKNKVYSLHEPHIYCISKGKEHKKYEYGTKASIAWTNKSGIIVGALNLPENQYDGKTIPAVLDQVERITEYLPDNAVTDQGYRGIKSYKGTVIVNADRLKLKRISKYEKEKVKKMLRRRAGIEPIIGHLKSHFRLSRNYLSGNVGDEINVMLAAAGFNFKKWMNLAYCLYKLLKSNLDFSIIFSF